jgi:hypothetical protein
MKKLLIDYFDTVEVPGADGAMSPETLLTEIYDWVHSPPLQELLTYFDAPKLSGDLVQQLRVLDDFTADVWDFRRRSDGSSVERNQVDLKIFEDPEVERGIVSAARALGLVDPRLPKRQKYNYIIVLGGLVRANAWRSEYAGYLLSHGLVKCEKVVGLSANRPLAPHPSDPSRDEFALLNKLGFASAQYESEVLDQALCRVFRTDRLDDMVADNADVPIEARKRVATATTDLADVTLVVAPPENPSLGKRADTAATYRYWASRVHSLERGASALVITSCIYVPYHALVAIHHIGAPFGISIETVGYDEKVVDTSAAPQSFRAVNYLQEIRSTLRAALSLAEKLGGDQ